MKCVKTLEALSSFHNYQLTVTHVLQTETRGQKTDSLITSYPHPLAERHSRRRLDYSGTILACSRPSSSHAMSVSLRFQLYNSTKCIDSCCQISESCILRPASNSFFGTARHAFGLLSNDISLPYDKVPGSTSIMCAQYLLITTCRSLD